MFSNKETIGLSCDYHTIRYEKFVHLCKGFFTQCVCYLFFEEMNYHVLEKDFLIKPAEVMNSNYIVLDTSGLYNFLAIIDSSKTPLIYTLPEHTELGGVLNGVFHYLSSCLENLQGIGVCIGPGNFSATRVGFAFAMGLACALNIPIVGYSSLEGYLTCNDNKKALLLPLGKRGGIFVLASEFSADGGGIHECINKLGTLTTYDKVDLLCQEHHISELLYVKSDCLFKNTIQTVHFQERKRDLNQICNLIISRLRNSDQLWEPDYRSCTAFF